MFKEFARWLIRRDADAGSTVLGGKVEELGSLLTILLGVKYGVLPGISFYAMVKITKVIAGWTDYRIGVTKYRNAYASAKAPMKVKIIEEDKEQEREYGVPKRF